MPTLCQAVITAAGGTGMAYGFQGRTTGLRSRRSRLWNRKALSRGIHEWAHRNRRFCKQMTSSGSRQAIWRLELFIEFTFASVPIDLAPAEKKGGPIGPPHVLQFNPLPGERRPEADMACGLPEIRLPVHPVLNDPVGLDRRLRVVSGFNCLVERRAAKYGTGAGGTTGAATRSWREQRRTEVIRVECLPVRGNGVLIQQVGKGCVKAQYLSLIVLVHLDRMLKVEIGLGEPRRAARIGSTERDVPGRILVNVDPVAAAKDVRALENGWSR
jgi:hypothetical protein